MTDAKEKTKHTPGPWAIAGEFRRRVVKNAKGATVVVIEHWTTEHDARLIAAAPDMLEALKKTQAITADVDRDAPARLDEIFLLVRAALSKAGG